MRKTLMAVAALTAGAAFAVQHHLHRRRIRAVKAAAITERLAADRAHEAHLHEVGQYVGQVVAVETVVDAATRVIDREWARNQYREEEGDGDV